MRANPVKTYHPVHACARMGAQAPQALPRRPEALPRCPPGAAQARPRRSPGGAPAAKRPQALQALLSAAKQKPEAGVARRCQALLGAPSTPSSSWALPGAAQSLQGVTRRSLGAPMRVLGVPQAICCGALFTGRLDPVRHRRCIAVERRLSTAHDASRWRRLDSMARASLSLPTRSIPFRIAAAAGRGAA